MPEHQRWEISRAKGSFMIFIFLNFIFLTSQQFRLANTGLKVFYLVESHEAEKHQEIFGVQIDTARSSTQVVDGFILKVKQVYYYLFYRLTLK